ncbi:hypothetical protein FQN57_007418 [Myotisia sp. PD_48]|nr:hypothetical protein FQN57_007418 [Myotisia sp. PD_48]
MDVPVAANILGTIGAVCWSVQLIPQIIVNYRRHHAIGLQSSMMMLWAWAGVPLGVYNIVEEFNIALRIQPQILSVLSLMTWIQCYYYQKNWRILHCLTAFTLLAFVMGGIEATLIIALRIARKRHLDWPMTLMAVLSAVLLAAGVLRHYWDIYTHRTVRGISFIFVGIDAAGDLFSLISILFQPGLDILGMAIYGSELLLWIGVFMCGGYFNLGPWLRKKRDKREVIRDTLSSQEDPASLSHEAGRSLEVIELHNLPSSTSVFRTPSSELAAVNSRPRTI